VRTINVEVGAVEDLIEYMDYLDLWPEGSKSSNSIPVKVQDDTAEKKPPEPKEDSQGSLF